MIIKNLWDTAKAVLREVYSNTILPQETRKKKNQIDDLTLHLKQLEKEEQKNLPKLVQEKKS